MLLGCATRRWVAQRDEKERIADLEARRRDREKERDRAMSREEAARAHTVANLLTKRADVRAGRT